MKRRAGANSSPRHPAAVRRQSGGAQLPGKAKDLVDQIRACRDTLEAEQRDLEQWMAELESAIEAMESGSRAGANRALSLLQGGEPGRGRSLKDYIVAVLQSAERPMTPSEIAQAVVTAGHQSQSKTLTTQVSNALARMEVRKVAHGLYRL